ncbi:glycoside hydrolase family 5 protein [Glutamicibacter sp. X7]
MIKHALAACALAAVGLSAISLPAAHTDSQVSGFSVHDGKIYDANQKQFVPQGINLPYAWFKNQDQSFADARQAGANTVRVVLSGDRWGPNTAEEVSHVIELCKDNHLVCILENHDTTGFGEDPAATSLAEAVEYWTSVAEEVKGQEGYVMINIGNEPYGNSDTSRWADDTISAVQELRAVGVKNTLIVDAPNWGQDWSLTMRDTAEQVSAADDNLVFDVHMYGVFDTPQSVTDYIDSFTSRNLAIMVGEFADFHTSGIPAVDTILSYTRSENIGMLGWSWSGNGGADAPLDLVKDFDATQLTSWGERFINGADGLKERRALPASVYTRKQCHKNSQKRADRDHPGSSRALSRSCR